MGNTIEVPSLANDATYRDMASPHGIEVPSPADDAKYIDMASPHSNV